MLRPALVRLAAMATISLVMRYLRLLVQEVRKHFFLQELDYKERYGEDSWAVVTGASSGQGRLLALNFARKGLNLLLIGSERTKDTIAELDRVYPRIKTKLIVKDFGRAFKRGFFKDIRREMEALDVSVVVNSVGHRTGWAPYHEQPPEVIERTIACGTLVQSELTRLGLQRFARRKIEREQAGLPSKHTGLLFITAQCTTASLGLTSPSLSAPYLAVYDASNAFGFYHAASIHEEYVVQAGNELSGSLDVLNVTPGAVITENTEHLEDVPFAIDADTYVGNIMRLLGNVQGSTCAYWMHALSSGLGLFPGPRSRILADVGENISTRYMESFRCGAEARYSARRKRVSGQSR